MIYYSNNYLAHHGILGQKWGKRNGPPYPLDANDHSAAEKKAGWRKSIDVRTKQDKKDERNTAKASKIADKINKKSESGSVYVGQQVLAKYLEEHGADSAVKYVKSDQYKQDVKNAVEKARMETEKFEAQEKAIVEQKYKELKQYTDEYDNLIKDKKLTAPYNQQSNALMWFMPEADQLDSYTSDDLTEDVEMAKQAVTQMKKWVKDSDSNPVDKRTQSKNSIELEDTWQESRNHDSDYGERVNYLLNSNAMKKFFNDPVVNDILTMRNRMLDGGYDDMIVYGAPEEAYRALRYRAKALFGGNEDLVSKIIERIDMNNDYDTSLNPYYNEASWLYWH